MQDKCYSNRVWVITDTVPTGLTVYHAVYQFSRACTHVLRVRQHDTRKTEATGCQILLLSISCSQVRHSPSCLTPILGHFKLNQTTVQIKLSNIFYPQLKCYQTRSTTISTLPHLFAYAELLLSLCLKSHKS